MEVAKRCALEGVGRSSYHEAGHAVVAVKYHLRFEYVEILDGESGESKLFGGPLDNPNLKWREEAISQWQQAYAAGAAAEMLFFGSYRTDGSSSDLRLHGNLEKLRGQNRSDGWDQDIQSTMKILDCDSVEKVASVLNRKKRLSVEQVYELLNLESPD
jgi:hypothetical protein